jgi:hypothetical protein
VEDGARWPGGEWRGRALGREEGGGGREGMRRDAPRAWGVAVVVNAERETGF